MTSRQLQIQERASALIEWLVSDACYGLGGNEFVAAVGEVLNNCGLPIEHLAVHVRALSPTLFGQSIVWHAGEPVTSLSLRHEARDLNVVQQGPLGYVTSRRQWLALRPDEQRWSATEMLPFKGMAEVWIAPMVCGPADPTTHAVSFGTRRSKGFHQDHIALLHRILPVIRSAVELKIWPHMTATILDTYLGRDPEKRVLSGRIRRGDVETIEAAIMFCDLNGFTQLSNRLSSDRILELLNTYFDQVVPSVTDRSGEVLKFMGDGLLAVFRTDGNAEACDTALDAASSKLLGVSQHGYIGWELDRKKPTARHVPAIIKFLGYDPSPAGQSVGSRLLARRRSLGLTQRSAANILRLDEGTYLKYERDEWLPKHERSRRVLDWLRVGR